MQATLNKSLSSGGLKIGGTSLIDADTDNPTEVPIPAAIAGTLTTRTDANTGVLTVATGHGITTSHKLDLYDSAGTLIRKTVDVTATTGTTISIDGGTGVSPATDLPAATSVVNAARQIVVLLSIFDDKIQAFGASVDVPGGTQQCRMHFQDASPATVLDEVRTVGSGLIDYVAAGEPNSIDNSGDGVAKVTVTHGNTLVPGTLKIISMEDRTP